MASTTAARTSEEATARRLPDAAANAAVPPEAARRAALEAMMGPRPVAHNRTAMTIRHVVEEQYRRTVLPLTQEHWPSSLPGGPDAATGDKLRFLACALYGVAPYTALFCAEQRPFLFDVVSKLSTLPIMPTALIPAGARTSVRIFAGVGDGRAQRRIVLIAAFIATIDHVFDHTLATLKPRERSTRIRGLLDGTVIPDATAASAPLRLTRALQLEMGNGLSPEDESVFEAAMDRVLQWCDGEAQALEGVPDPRGLCHRLAGVEGAIDGLIFPVHRYAGEAVRRWMYDVSWFVQMMDDWLDVEKDIVDKRETPAITGVWNEQTLRRKWSDTVTGLEAIALASGPANRHRSEVFVNMVRDAYVCLMHDVRQAMSEGIAA